MKSIKQILFVAIITLLSSQAIAQFSAGGQVSYLNLFGGTGIKSLGFGLKGEYGYSDNTVITGGVNYFLGSKFSETTYGNAASNQTSPSQIEVDLEYKITFIHLYVGAKRYFVGEYEDDFGLYGIGEAGYMVAPIGTER